MMDTPNQGIALLGAFLFSLAGVFNLYQIRRLKEGKKDLFEGLYKVMFGHRYYVSTPSYYLGQSVFIIFLTIFSLAGLYLLIKGAFAPALTIASAVFYGVTSLRYIKIKYYKGKEKGPLEFECPDCGEALFEKELKCPDCKMEFIEGEGEGETEP